MDGGGPGTSGCGFYTPRGMKRYALTLLTALSITQLTACDEGVDTELPTTIEPMVEDLFACTGLNELIECETVVAHDDSEPLSALECAGLAAYAGHGLIRTLDTPGPNIDETDTLILMLDDDQALVQQRSRHCDPSTEACSFEDLPWEPTRSQQICDVTVPDMFAEDCAASCEAGECSCPWDPIFGGLANCRDVDEEWSCGDVAAHLAVEAVVNGCGVYNIESGTDSVVPQDPNDAEITNACTDLCTAQAALNCGEDMSECIDQCKVRSCDVCPGTIAPLIACEATSFSETACMCTEQGVVCTTTDACDDESSATVACGG